MEKAKQPETTVQQEQVQLTWLRFGSQSKIKSYSGKHGASCKWWCFPHHLYLKSKMLSVIET